MTEDNSHILQLQSLNKDMEIEIPQTLIPNNTSQQLAKTCSHYPVPKMWKRSSSRLGRLQRRGSTSPTKEDSKQGKRTRETFDEAIEEVQATFTISDGGPESHSSVGRKQKLFTTHKYTNRSHLEPGRVINRHGN
ncbi:RNA-binding protein [Striga asiatica]|uniref:RNA-binding protein n=1 Tax=Striga asiatica TaxID=4170 RepID=A0A5A7P0F8_STRAF|nr:RNA-binding protein [Striga asiatica]